MKKSLFIALAVAMLLPLTCMAEGTQGQGPKKQGPREHQCPMLRFDANKDGVITKDELPKDDPRAAGFFARLDSNKDGKVTKQEMDSFASEMKKKFEQMKAQREKEQANSTDPKAKPADGAQWHKHHAQGHDGKGKFDGKKGPKFDGKGPKDGKCKFDGKKGSKFDGKGPKDGKCKFDGKKGPKFDGKGPKDGKCKFDGKKGPKFDGKGPKFDGKKGCPAMMREFNPDKAVEFFFSKADTNKDGQISKAELKAFFVVGHKKMMEFHKNMNKDGKPCPMAR